MTLDKAREIEIRSWANAERNVTPCSNNITVQEHYAAYSETTSDRIKKWSADELDCYAREAEDLIKLETKLTRDLMVYIMRKKEFVKMADRKFADEYGCYLKPHWRASGW